MTEKLKRKEITLTEKIEKKTKTEKSCNAVWVSVKSATTVTGSIHFDVSQIDLLLLLLPL